MTSFIGIDIGLTVSQVVQVDKKKKLTLTEAFSFSTPYNPDNPEELDYKTFFKEIADHIPLVKFRESEIGINFSSSLANVLIVELPRMSKKELEVAAISQARRMMVPTPGPDSVFSHLIVGASKKDDTEYLEILIVKTEKNYTEGTLKAFEDIGQVIPKMISPTCFTIFNLFPSNHEIYKEDTAFINIGNDSLDISISKNGRLHFHRNIKFGLRDIKLHLAGALNKEDSDLEKIMYEQGVPQANVDMSDKIKLAEEIMKQKYEASMDQGANEVNSLELRMLWDSEIERIVTEIRRTFTYYKEQVGGNRVSNVFFLGKAVSIKGLFEALNETIGGNCSKLSLISDLDVSLAQDRDVETAVVRFAPSLAAVLGIALRTQKDRAINFLPREIIVRESLAKKQLVAIVCCITLLAFTSLWLLTALINKKNIVDSISTAEFNAQRYKSALGELKKVNDQRKVLKDRLGRVEDKVQKKQDLNILVLSRIAAVKPKNIRFSSLSILPLGSMLSSEGLEKNIIKKSSKNSNTYGIEISAICLSNYEDSLITINQFKEDLEKISWLTKVTLDLPELLTLSPIIDEEDQVILTEQLERGFSVKAELINSEK